MEKFSIRFCLYLRFLRKLGSGSCRKLALGQTEHQNTADGVAEEQRQNRDYRELGLGGGFFHLFQSDDADNQGEDQPALKHHAENDEDFCCCFHNMNLLVVFIVQKCTVIIIP